MTLVRRVVGWALIVGALLIGAGLTHVVVASVGRVVDVDDAPARPAAIVLGARAHTWGPSGFLAARLDLAVTLWEDDKVESILVSGDGRAASNDEPAVMRRYLEERGVPSEAIVEDPGGYDTYDTCRRARDTYGLTRVTVLTQDYHVRRVIAICRWLGVDAVGVGEERTRSQDPVRWAKAFAREPFTYLKMEADLLSDREPAAGVG